MILDTLTSHSYSTDIFSKQQFSKSKEKKVIEEMYSTTTLSENVYTQVGPPGFSTSFEGDHPLGVNALGFYAFGIPQEGFPLVLLVSIFL